jgi:hypothetical protein
VPLNRNLFLSPASAWPLNQILIFHSLWLLEVLQNDSGDKARAAHLSAFQSFYPFAWVELLV